MIAPHPIPAGPMDQPTEVPSVTMTDEPAAVEARPGVMIDD
jgi:hypothetical protein